MYAERCSATVVHVRSINKDRDARIGSHVPTVGERIGGSLAFVPLNNKNLFRGPCWTLDQSRRGPRRLGFAVFTRHLSSPLLIYSMGFNGVTEFAYVLMGVLIARKMGDICHLRCWNVRAYLLYWVVSIRFVCTAAPVAKAI